MSTEKEETVDAFAVWDTPEDIQSAEDVFGEAQPEEEIIKDTEDTEGVSKGESKEETEEQEDAFSEFEESTEEGEEGEEEIVQDSPESLKTLEFLKEKGLVDYQLEEGEELTPERAEELLESSFEDKVESRLEEMFSEMDPYAKRFTHFVLKGGDPRKFLDTAAPAEISRDLDLSKKENQTLVLRAQLAKEGKSPEEIDSEIEYYQDAGKTKELAEKKYERYLKETEKSQKALVEQQEAQKKEKLKQQKEFRQNLQDFVSKNDTVAGLKLSKEDKKELPSYMYETSVTLENGAKVTEMQVGLHKVMQDQEQSVALAKLIKTGFDFSSLQENIKNKVTRQVKDTLEGRNVKSTPKQKRNKNFVEYL